MGEVQESVNSDELVQFEPSLSIFTRINPIDWIYLQNAAVLSMLVWTSRSMDVNDATDFYAFVAMPKYIEHSPDILDPLIRTQRVAPVILPNKLNHVLWIGSLFILLIAILLAIISMTIRKQQD